MEASELARWTRFAAKGGIGSCTATCDCVAQSADDLMFLKGDVITVLMQSDAPNTYLGYCEGVVGRFSGDNVHFHAKLKRPVMTKRGSTSGDASGRSLGVRSSTLDLRGVKSHDSLRTQVSLDNILSRESKPSSTYDSIRTVSQASTREARPGSSGSSVGHGAGHGEPSVFGQQRNGGTYGQPYNRGVLHPPQTPSPLTSPSPSSSHFPTSPFGPSLGQRVVSSPEKHNNLATLVSPAPSAQSFSSQSTFRPLQPDASEDVDIHDFSKDELLPPPRRLRDVRLSSVTIDSLQAATMDRNSSSSTEQLAFEGEDLPRTLPLRLQEKSAVAHQVKVDHPSTLKKADSLPGVGGSPASSRSASVASSLSSYSRSSIRRSHLDINITQVTSAPDIDYGDSPTDPTLPQSRNAGTRLSQQSPRPAFNRLSSVALLSTLAPSLSRATSTRSSGTDGETGIGLTLLRGGDSDSDSETSAYRGYARRSGEHILIDGLGIRDSLASSDSEGGLGYARSDTDGASVDEDKQYADDEVARGHGPSSSIASSAYSMSSSAKDSSESSSGTIGRAADTSLPVSRINTTSSRRTNSTSTTSTQRSISRRKTPRELIFPSPPSSTWAVVTSESPVDPLPLLGRSFTTPETSSVEYHIHPTGQTSASHTIPRSLSTPVAGTYRRVTPTQAVFPVREGAPAGSDDTEHGHELDLSGNVVRNDSVSTTMTSGEPLCRLKHDDSPPSLSSISPTGTPSVVPTLTTAYSTASESLDSPVSTSETFKAGLSDVSAAIMVMPATAQSPMRTSFPLSPTNASFGGFPASQYSATDSSVADLHTTCSANDSRQDQHSPSRGSFDIPRPSFRDVSGVKSVEGTHLQFSGHLDRSSVDSPRSSTSASSSRHLSMASDKPVRPWLADDRRSMLSVSDSKSIMSTADWDDIYDEYRFSRYSQSSKYSQGSRSSMMPAPRTANTSPSQTGPPPLPSHSEQHSEEDAHEAAIDAESRPDTTAASPAVPSHVPNSVERSYSQESEVSVYTQHSGVSDISQSSKLSNLTAHAAALLGLNSTDVSGVDEEEGRSNKDELCLGDSDGRADSMEQGTNKPAHLKLRQTPDSAPNDGHNFGGSLSTGQTPLLHTNWGSPVSSSFSSGDRHSNLYRGSEFYGSPKSDFDGLRSPGADQTMFLSKSEGSSASSLSRHPAYPPSGLGASGDVVLPPPASSVQSQNLHLPGQSMTPDVLDSKASAAEKTSMDTSVVGMVSRLRQRYENDRSPTQGLGILPHNDGGIDQERGTTDDSWRASGIVVTDESFIGSEVLPDEQQSTSSRSSFSGASAPSIGALLRRRAESSSPIIGDTPRDDSKDQSFRRQNIVEHDRQVSQSPEPQLDIKLPPLVIANATERSSPSPGTSGSTQEATTLVAETQVTLGSPLAESPASMTSSPDWLAPADTAQAGENDSSSQPQAQSSQNNADAESRGADTSVGTPIPRQPRPSLLELRGDDGGGTRTSLFMPHPNAPKPNNAGIGPMYIQDPRPPVNVVVNHPSSRPSAIAVIHEALRSPPPRFPYWRGPTIFGRMDVDLAHSMGPVFISFSVEPPPATAPGRRGPSTTVSRQPIVHASTDPHTVGHGVPPSASQAPSSRDGSSLSTYTTSDSMAPPTRSAPQRSSSSSTNPTFAGSRTITADHPGVRDRSPVPGRTDSVSPPSVRSDVIRPSSTTPSTATASVGKAIPRSNFSPRTGTARPRSRSFSGFDSTNPDLHSSSQPELKTSPSRRTTSLSSSSSTPIQGLTARVSHAPSPLKGAQSSAHSPSPLSLPQNAIVAPQAEEKSPKLKMNFSLSTPQFSSAVNRPSPLSQSSILGVSKLPVSSQPQVPPGGNEGLRHESTSTRPRQNSTAASEKSRYSSSTGRPSLDDSASFKSDHRRSNMTSPTSSLGPQSSIRNKLSLPNLRRVTEGSQPPQLPPIHSAGESVTVQVQDTDFELVHPFTVTPIRSSFDLRHSSESSTTSHDLDSTALSPRSVSSSNSPTLRSPSTVAPWSQVPPPQHGLTQSVESAEAHRQRELKWVSVMSSVPPSQSKKSRKVRRLLSDDVPSSVRYLVWSHVTDSRGKAVPGVYAQLSKRERIPAYAEIQRDVQQSSRDLGWSQESQASLLSLLQSYLTMVPDIHYSKGLTLISGHLLNMAPEEDAFWIFVCVMDLYLRPYFWSNTVQMEVDSALFARALEQNDALVAKKILTTLGVNPVDICHPWFSTLFVEILPPEYLNRVWDIVFFEGIPFLIRVGVVLIGCCRRAALEAPSKEILFRYLHRSMAKWLPRSVDAFLSLAHAVKLKDDDVRKQRIKMQAQIKRQTHNAPRMSMQSVGKFGVRAVQQ